MTVGVLKACGGGLVHHCEDIPAGAAEGLEGQEALRRPCVCGDADKSLKWLGRREGSNGRVGAQLTCDVTEETGERVEDRDAVVAQAQSGCVRHRRVGEQALERTQVRSALVGRVFCVEAVNQVIAVKRDN